MALSTKDLQESASVRKTIAPGNHTLKINNVELESFKSSFKFIRWRRKI